jgi:hypothetical protein
MLLLAVVCTPARLLEQGPPGPGVLHAEQARSLARPLIIAPTAVQPLAETLPLRAEPLKPLTLTLRVAGYAGPAELRFYDARLAPAGSATAQVRNEQARFTLLPRGALGPQWAIVLLDGRIVTVYDNLVTLEATTTLESDNADLDALVPTVRGFLEQDVVRYELDGQPIRGYRSPDNPLIWLRDHVYQMRGFQYFEQDMTSALAAFRRAQRPDGSFPDVLAYPARGTPAYRLDTESDLEFLFVLGVYEAWQATGDDAWLRENLRAMRRGLRYIMNHPLRWDAELGLVRRPYTIDMWDFEHGPSTRDPRTGNPAPRHWIDEQTRWGIFHGDNTGLAYALRLMARIEEQLGNPAQAQQWTQQRRALMERLNALSWNGDFYTHFVPLEGELNIPGVDTDAQLSLSNAYALNREVLEFQQGRDIVSTYYNRRDFARAFAEWYSIDPPFPPGSYGMGGRPGELPGEYVNGGIMPVTGGELARGAFRHALEAYGFDILRRYAALVRLTGESYLWYYPSGAPGISGPDTLATDGWGSSAMLAALLQGAAGIEDRSALYHDLRLSPRWAAAPEMSAVRVVTRYAASKGYVAYTWERAERGLLLDATGSWRRAEIRLLLPAEGVGKQETITVRANAAIVPTQIDKVGGRRYVIVAAQAGNTRVEVTWE